MAERVDAASSAGDLSWERSYDRTSVERYLDEAGARRDQLQAELEGALARGARARADLERREAVQNSELEALVREGRRQLDALDADHEAAVERVRTVAFEEIQRIRTAAASAADGGVGT